MRGLKCIWIMRGTRLMRGTIALAPGACSIATGRDAVDVAFWTLYGHAQLLELQVWADEVPEDFFELDGGLHERRCSRNG